MTSYKLYRRRERLAAVVTGLLSAAAWLLWLCVIALTIAGISAVSWFRNGCEPEDIAVKAAMTALAVAGVVALVSVMSVIAARFFERAWDKTWDHDGSDIW